MHTRTPLTHAQELGSAGFMPAQLRAAGFGAPGSQPPGVMGRALLGLVRMSVEDLPPLRRTAGALGAKVGGGDHAARAEGGAARASARRPGCLRTT